MYRSPFESPTPIRPAPDVDDPARAVSGVSRSVLAFGALLALAAPLLWFEPAAGWGEDLELLRLLRGMALLKGLLAILALSVVAWRLGRPTTAGQRVAYVGGVWAMMIAATMVWSLTAIPIASVLFHGAILLLLVTAWRDSGGSKAQPAS